MASAAELGLGAAITISGSEIAEVTDLGDFGITRPELDVTNHDSSGNAEEFIAGLIQAQEITVTCNLKTGDTNGQMAAITACAAGTVCPFGITLPNTAASTFVFTGRVKSYRIKADTKGVLKITFVIKQDKMAPTWTV